MTQIVTDNFTESSITDIFIALIRMFDWKCFFFPWRKIFFNVWYQVLKRFLLQIPIQLRLLPMIQWNCCKNLLCWDKWFNIFHHFNRFPLLDFLMKLSKNNITTKDGTSGKAKQTCHAMLESSCCFFLLLLFLFFSPNQP